MSETSLFMTVSIGFAVWSVQPALPAHGRTKRLACVRGHKATPDFRPASVATLAGGQLAPIQPPNDGFFEPVTFIGAVGPNPGDDWTQGWTSYPQR